MQIKTGPLAGFEYVFKCLFLNDAGRQADKQGIETDGEEKYFQVIHAVLVLTEIESYYQTPKPHNGGPVCNIRTKSGDIWSILITLEELIEIKKNYGYTFN